MNWRMWGWPIVLGVLSATGLVTALISDSVGDWYAWVALGIPVLVMLWYGYGRPARCAPSGQQ